MPTDDAKPSNFTLVSTPAQPDLPICFDALTASVCTNPDTPATSMPDTQTLLGPCQALLESSPHAVCKQHIAPSFSASIIYDGCNGTSHLACVGLKVLPLTFWYCKTCTRQLHTAGIREPAEYLAFQQYLLMGKADPTLQQYFTSLAAHHHYEERLRDQVTGKYV